MRTSSSNRSIAGRPRTWIPLSAVWCWKRTAARRAAMWRLGDQGGQGGLHREVREIREIPHGVSFSGSSPISLCILCSLISIAARHNRAHELLRHLLRHLSVRIREGDPPCLNGRSVLPEVLLTVHTHGHVPFERLEHVRRQVVRQVTHEEVYELAAGHGCPPSWRGTRYLCPIRRR